MPQLAGAGYRVIAVDPRGMGESDAPVGSYDMATVSTELHHFASQIGLFENGPIAVVAPDVGSRIDYAGAVDCRSDIRRVALFRALIPGLSAPPPDLTDNDANLRHWHFSLNPHHKLPNSPQPL